MDRYDFIAIDVETATSAKPRFICQIGLAYVLDGEIVKKESYLVQPPHNHIEYRNTMIHGIYESDTAQAPTLPQVWEKIGFDLRYNQLVAHNAKFDEAVIAENLYHFRIPNNLRSFICTYELLHLGLEDLCYAYQIAYTNHHDACFDAACCAQFYINYQQGLHPQFSRIPQQKKKSTYRVLTGDVLKQDLSQANPQNPFYNQKVVITGTFRRDRMELAEQIQQLGAKINTSISSRTNFVLKGEKAGPAKLKRIHELQSQGVPIHVVEEEKLMKVLEKWCE